MHRNKTSKRAVLEESWMLVGRDKDSKLVRAVFAE